MDAVLLSRLQFALATFFHFLYVPLTLGLSCYVAIMETRYVKTGDEGYKAQAKFWGRIFLINFAIGVVTGITLEFQFGTNWARYSSFVGDIFGSLLAIEATVAFFLESTFIAVWAFGWNRISKKLHLAAIWFVAAASCISALWILLANGFMQLPQGYHIPVEGGRAELASFMDVFTNPYGWGMFLHTLAGAFVLTGFFTMGVSSFNLLRGRQPAFFARAFKLGMVFALLASVLTLLFGHHMGQVAHKHQPAKLAALESHWETGANAPIYVLALPNPTGDGNLIQAIKIPGVLSFLAGNSFETEVKGLSDFKPEDRPPVMLTFLSFRLMVMLGFLFILLALWALWASRDVLRHKVLLVILVCCIPLPYLALQFGWVVTEVGRQPWIVYGLMRTSAAVSPVTELEVAGSLVIMAGIYTVLTALGIFLIGRVAWQGPKVSDGLNPE